MLLVYFNIGGVLDRSIGHKINVQVDVQSRRQDVHRKEPREESSVTIRLSLTHYCWMMMVMMMMIRTSAHGTLFGGVVPAAVSCNNDN